MHSGRGGAGADDGVGGGDRARRPGSRQGVGQDRPSEPLGQSRTRAGSECRGDRPPAMMSPRPWSGSDSAPRRRARSARSGDDDPRAGARRERSRPSPVSGSRNARLRWTGPGPAGPWSASAKARTARGRQVSSWPSAGTPGVSAQRVAEPKRPVCSMVCGAPVWCSSGGRSAVHTMSGTRPWCASTTAGCSSAAAVPLVTQMTVGRPVAIANPARRRRHCARRGGRGPGGDRPEGQRQRGRARAGADDRVGDPEADPLVDQGGAEGGLYAHPACHSMSKCAVSGPPLVVAARIHADRTPVGPLR